MKQIEHSTRAYDGATLVWHREAIHTLSDGSIVFGPWVLVRVSVT